MLCTHLAPGKADCTSANDILVSVSVSIFLCHINCGGYIRSCFIIVRFWGDLVSTRTSNKVKIYRMDSVEEFRETFKFFSALIQISVQ